MIRRMVDAPLKHTATMTVRRDFDTVGSHSVVDELGK